MSRGMLRCVAPATLLALTCASSVAQAAPPQSARAKPTAKPTCTICAVLSFADDVIFASPPLLRLPEAVEFLYLTTDAEFVHLKSTGFAPPAARHNS
jgi:hypothetical protein